MTISRLRVMLKQGHTGTFRLLSPGETIEPADLIVRDCFYESVPDHLMQQVANHSDCIIRLEFSRTITKRRTIHKS